MPMGVLEKIPLAEDELEALRLCDLQGMTQEEAGRHMGVSRGTVQRTVKSARSKVARALVDGAALVLNQVSREE
jgi:RNA polymerase sigma factor (sigma-70 family)